MKSIFFFIVLLPFFFRIVSAQQIEGYSKPVKIDIGTARSSETKTVKEYFKASIQRWAVVIGISKYQNTSKGITPLRFADADAISFYDFLKSSKGGSFPTSNMKLLTNENATLANITSAINVFLAKAVEDDIVIIFFAGHGSPDPNNPKNLFFLTYDTDPETMASSGYLMEDLKRAMDRFIKARNVLIFTDACHSSGVSGQYGTRGKESDAMLNKYLLNLAQAENSTLVFTSSEANELSQESSSWGGGHGVFTWSMLQGLNGEADADKDGIVSLGELLDYTQDKVRRETKAMQHPDNSSTKFDRRLPMSILKPDILR
jgi:uncharacterized caspase-like protein